MGGYSEHSKYVYNEMPDFTLGVLQDRFNAKQLETLYKKYEQRYQLSESFLYNFAKTITETIKFLGNFTIFLLLQALVHFGIFCTALSMPSKYCYKNGSIDDTDKCRLHIKIIKL